MSRRGERIRPYAKQYLKGDDWLTLDQRPVPLCQKLEAEVAGKGSKRSSTSNGWGDFPWLSLVIGTGCLEVPGASAGFATATAEAVSQKLQHAQGRWDIGPYEGLVADFTRSLVTDRLMATRPSLETPPVTDSSKASSEAAELTLAAALLTSLYHQISNAAPHAMSRWENDVARLDVDAGSSESARLEPLVQTTLKVLESAKGRMAQQGSNVAARTRTDPEARVARAVSVLLDETWNDLSSKDQVRTIPVQRVRLLTEVAWYFLRKDEIYPGWTDLLLRLMLSQTTRSAGRSPRRPRPRYQDQVELSAAAEGILVAPSNASWTKTREWHASGTKELDEHSRQRLYHSVAHVLWAQSDARLQGAPDSNLLPPAAVFTTTLDLEVEMALRATRPQEPFRVAVPTYLFSGDSTNEAHFCWLMGDVPPSPYPDDLGDLRWLRTVQDWRVLDELRFSREQSHAPVVIHLSGTPLLKPPGKGALSKKLAEQLRADGITGAEEASFVAAITVDEYLAMRQSESELAWLVGEDIVAPTDKRGELPEHLDADEDPFVAADGSHRRRDSAPGARKRRGLPQRFTEPGSPAGTVRFWMVMGVPMADPAVRNRVLAQLATVHRISVGKAPDSTTAAAPTSKLGPRPSPKQKVPSEVGTDAEASSDEIHGAAVTLHIDDDEVALLHWLGLDVVEESCHAYADDLLHYADHVRATGAGRRAGSCNGTGPA